LFCLVFFIALPCEAEVSDVDIVGMKFEVVSTFLEEDGEMEVEPDVGLGGVAEPDVGLEGVAEPVVVLEMVNWRLRRALGKNTIGLCLATLNRSHKHQFHQSQSLHQLKPLVSSCLTCLNWFELVFSGLNCLELVVMKIWSQLVGLLHPY
jgi:hypothetical protein